MGDAKNNRLALNRIATTHFVVVVLATALVVAVAFLFHVLFSRTISNLTVEIMAAVLAVVLVVSSVCVTIHFQNEAEKKRQFQIEVFQTKLNLYQELLKHIMESDDDDEIKKDELEKMRNLSSVAALVASKELLGALAGFIERVSQEGQLKPKDTENDNRTYRCVIQKMREDLNVVEGNVEKCVEKLIAM